MDLPVAPITLAARETVYASHHPAQRDRRGDGGTRCLRRARSVAGDRGQEAAGLGHKEGEAPARHARWGSLTFAVAPRIYRRPHAGHVLRHDGARR